jgi:hypothetical protein
MASEELQVSDSVWQRVVQIVQEGMLTMTDVSDALRLVRLQEVDGKLELSDSYKGYVATLHDKLVEEGKRLSASRTSDD